MKKIIFVLISIFSAISLNAQDYPIEMPYNSELAIIEYQSVLDLNDQSAKQIFDKANEWFSYSFKSGKHVIDYSNPEMNKVIGKGYLPFKFFSRGEQTIEFLIKLEAKDEKIRYTISNCIYHQSDSPTLGRVNLEKDSWKVEDYPKSWGFKKKFYTRFDEQVKELIDSLEKFMNRKSDTAW
jgi:CCR4-NOT transcriptional regulation complex NOT5 subunit